MTDDNDFGGEDGLGEHNAPARISRREGASTLRPAPAIILVEPQMGENIGASARAMLNFGLAALRLVSPRDGWPNPKAGAMAAGAAIVIDGARVFSSVRDATADCSFVLATTARAREVALPVFDPPAAAAALKQRIARGERCAVLFGGERSGLSNDDVMRADGLVSIPVNPAFASLNLAQAVLLVGYEWARFDGRQSFEGALETAAAATREDFDRLIDHFSHELMEAGFFYPPEKKDVMIRNLRTIFTRAAPTETEVRTLRGAIKALAHGRGSQTAGKKGQ